MMYPRPKTGLESKFSMEYAIAAALLDDRLTISTFETPAIERAEIATLIDKIETREDPVQAIEDPIAAGQAGVSGAIRIFRHVSLRAKSLKPVCLFRPDIPANHLLDPSYV